VDAESRRTLIREWLTALGLTPTGRLRRDSHLLAAIVAGPLFWGLFWLFGTGFPFPADEPTTAKLASALLYYPVVEELFFRGLLQGAMARRREGRYRLLGITTANVVASAAFTGWHVLFTSSVALWVLVPSLVYGHLRDRQGHVYGAVLTHTWYNLTFVVALGMMGA